MLLLLTAAATPAGAASDAKARAKKHYAAGQAAFAKQRYEDAIREFDAGYQQVPDAAFLYNLGQSHRKAGHLAQALDYYEKFLATEPPEAAAAKIKIIIGELHQQLDKDKLAEPAPPPPATPAVDPFAPPPPPPTGPDPFALPPPTPKRGPSHKLAYGLIAAGGVLLLGGGGMLVGAGLSAGQYDSAYQTCFAGTTKACRDASLASLPQQSLGLLIGGAVSLGVGAALAATGVYLRLSRREKKVALVPLSTPAGLGVALSWSLP